MRHEQKIVVPIALFCLLLPAFCSWLHAQSPDLTAPICGLTNDSTNHVPDALAWRSFTPPSKGGTYVDSTYGCAIKRLTDGNADGIAHHHYYSTVNPMSAADTKVFVYDEDSTWHIIDLNGNTVVPAANMPAGGNNGLLLWDRTDDAVFWMTSGNNLQRCTVSGSSVSCVTNHTFSEYGYVVNLMDSTDMTPGGWLPMVGQNIRFLNMDVFLFNPANALKSPVYTTTCVADANTNNNICLHKLIGTPNDGVVIGFFLDGSLPEEGKRLWESPWTTPLPHVQDATSNSDSGRDLNGNAVGPFAAYNDNPGPFGNCAHGWRATLITLPNTINPSNCMFDAPNVVPTHVSYRDWPARPWVVFSAMPTSASEYFNNDSNYADPSSANWSTYTNEILLVRVDAANDPTKIFRLALSHSRSQQGFWAAPRAAISWDGKYVVFDSNAAWGATGCGNLEDCTDLYLIQLY